MLRDVMNHVNVKTAFEPKAAIADNTAAVSAEFDCIGAKSVMLAFVTGTDADADATFAVLLEETDTAGSGYTTVAAADMVGTPALAGFNFADDAETRKLGYVGIKRYLRATITPANNTGNFFVGGMWIAEMNRQATINPPM